MHSQNVEAIVLKVYDVGEADRFCVLLTREKGRLAARARGVRKLTSRMGGALLPFSHVHVELKEFGEGFLIASAQRIVSSFSFFVFRSSIDGEMLIDSEDEETKNQKRANEKRVLQAFSQAQQGTELLLKLLHNGQPLSEVFDATLQFLRPCNDQDKNSVLSFTFHLLHLLGHLPENTGAYFEGCSEEDRQFVTQARNGDYASLSNCSSTLYAIASALINDQISSPLRAGVAAAALS